MKFNSLDRGFEWIESFANFERTGPAPGSPADPARTFRLGRMEALLASFGNPHREFPSIHVAGSKGKGSTSAILAAILTESGYRTGLYLSPHVVSYRERITLSGAEFPDPVYLDTINLIAARLPGIELPGREEPSTFELLTLLCFLIFRSERVDWAVVEVGLGGRLDATNTLLPKACVITPIELEHTDVLGDSLTAIAREKGGIIKPGVPVFVSGQAPEVRAVFTEMAREKDAPLSFLDDPGISIRAVVKGGTPTGRADPCSAAGSKTEGGMHTEVAVTLPGEPERRFRLALLGEHQAHNAALAALALKTLRDRGDIPAFSWEAASRGLERVSIPGRMELACRRPPIVLDGAHTPLSTSRTADLFTRLFPGRRLLLFGSVHGKDPASMAANLAQTFDTIIVTTPGTFKKSDPEGVYGEFVSRNPNTRLIADPVKALAAAISESRGETPILVTGSFYTVGVIRPLALKKREPEET